MHPRFREFPRIPARMLSGNMEHPPRCESGFPVYSGPHCRDDRRSQIRS
jgi:hypothetical protein